MVEESITIGETGRFLAWHFAGKHREPTEVEIRRLHQDFNYHRVTHNLATEASLKLSGENRGWQEPADVIPVAKELRREAIRKAEIQKQLTIPKSKHKGFSKPSWFEELRQAYKKRNRGAVDVVACKYGIEDQVWQVENSLHQQWERNGGTSGVRKEW